MLQVVLDSLIRAAELSFLAVGLTMTYKVLRFPNFAHVEFATLGAYVALAFSANLGLPFLLATALAVVLVGGLGVGIDRAIFYRLRNASPIMLMIASFALGIAIRESVRAGWGPSPHFYSLGVVKPWRFLDLRVTPTQVAIIAAALIAMFAFHLFLSRTRLGTAMRATADNLILAQASGIDDRGVIRAVWLIGAGFAALGGAMIGLNTQIKPDMGFGIIIEVFAAAILGGIGHPYGAMLGALVVGFAENFGLAINWAPLLGALGFETGGFVYIPTGYKAALPFVLLVLTLLIRPRGLLGARR